MELYKSNYLYKLEEAALTPSNSYLDRELDDTWHYEQARKLHHASFLKNIGAFFTNYELSKIVIDKVKIDIADNSIFFDPSCGAGDLLLARAEQIGPSNSLLETLTLWSKLIAGVDINENFVRAAKARLILLARKLTNDYSDFSSSLDCFFDNLVVGDGLSVDIPKTERLVIIMNPPFNPMVSQKGCKWAVGSITTAAAFFYRFVKDSNSGTKIVSILPEVLRSGSRYEKWRNFICTNCIDMHVDTKGRFSNFANVDVFVLSATIQKNSKKKHFHWWNNYQTKEQNGVIGDYFNVNVGSVVPHRDEEIGEEHPYIFPKIVKPWEIIDHVDSYKRYSSRLFKPPFVALRRTSAPKDYPRCVASIVALSNDVSVENHFLVLTPKDGQISTCELCLKSLSNPKTTRWINERIKCRHLTVSSIAELPVWAEEVQ